MNAWANRLCKWSTYCYASVLCLRQYYRDEPTLNDDGAIENHPGISTSFKSKVKTTEKIPATDAADTADCCQ